MHGALDRTLIVMPAYNEEQAVAGVVREVFAKLPGVSVLVVSDGSHDDTAAQARSAGAMVVELPFNLGVGGAMRTGFLYARLRGYRAVVQVDADGQHDPSGVPAIVAQLEHDDVVIGARFAGEGDDEVRGPRKWAMRVLATTLSRITKTRLTDTTSGFRGAGPRAIELFADHYPAEYLGDTVESLVLASRAGLSVAQIPVSMRPRAGGTPSQNPWKSTVYLGRACMALLVAMWRPAVVVAEMKSA